MTDADRVGFFQIAVVEHCHIVVVVDLQHVGVAALAGVVEQPVADHAVIIAGVPRIIVGSLLIAAGSGFQRSTALIGSQDLVCRLLGGFLCGGSLLVGGLHRVAVGVGGGLGGAADHHILPRGPVIGLGIGIVRVLNLLIAVGQLIGVGVGISLILQRAKQLLTVDLLRHGAAQILLEILLDGGAAAHGRILQCLHGVVILGLHSGGILEALRLSFLQAVLDHGHLLDGIVHHVIMPGGSFLHAQHGRSGGIDGLSLQGRAGIQPQIADKIGVVLQKAAVHVLVIEADLGSRILLPIDGDGRCTAGDDIGLPDQAGHNRY